jgi:hypothetical protein
VANKQEALTLRSLALGHEVRSTFALRPSGSTASETEGLKLRLQHLAYGDNARCVERTGVNVDQALQQRYGVRSSASMAANICACIPVGDWAQPAIADVSARVRMLRSMA